MDIKYKYYPYPVLAEYLDDYKCGSFSTSADLVRDGYNLRLDFVAELTSKTLKELISSSKACYVYHLECSQTGFRRVIITQNIEERYPIDKRLVSGKLQVCTFIVAKEDIHNFSSPEFHDDYAGNQFEIEAGCVIAVGSQYNFDIYKEIDDISNLPSIFSITRNPDEKCNEMLVDYEGKKIIIKLPFNDFSIYKQLYNNPSSLNILNSLTIVPALTYVLGEIKRMSVEDRSELDNHLWYRTIRKVLQKTFEIDIENDDSIDQLNPLDFAQKLINSPITDAFKALYSVGESEDDD